MLDFEKPKIEIAEISEDKKYGRFVVEPLERGYGTTLGNSLRRIMLSSLPGVAVSQVKIDGVVHEFSSIPGVKEDVTEIIMNIKKLAIKNTSESSEPKTAYIEVEGDRVVTDSGKTLKVLYITAMSDGDKTQFIYLLSDVELYPVNKIKKFYE